MKSQNYHFNGTGSDKEAKRPCRPFKWLYFAGVMGKKMVILSGPTASGKSALALELASYFTVPILSADSRQVFRKVDIGTAKPDAAIRDRIQHFLIDHVDVGQTYNVGQYLHDAETVLQEISVNTEFTLVCGGTGLYTRALMEGLDDFPEVDPTLSESLRQIYLKEGLPELARELQALDPEYAEVVDLQNPHRVLRALAVLKSSGQKFSDFLGRKKGPDDRNFLHLLLELPRQELYDRINKRADQMMEAGLLEETERLREYWECQALDTVGYKELIHYLKGNWSLSEAIEKIKQHTRNYAKRQLTWYRKFHQGPILHPENKEEAIRLVSDFLRSN